MPRRLTVASEVATLAFVRARGIPTPRVLGYSAHDNPVGVEYILMEKLPGRPIGNAWFSLPEKDTLKDLHEMETLGYKKQDPEEHSNSQFEYLQLAPYLTPKIPKLNLPILRHPDIQPNNIFISEDFKITGLIDWQHSLVLPMFLAASIPQSFQSYGDEQFTHLIPPQLPKGINTMNADEHAIACEQFRRRHVHFFYLRFTQKLNKSHSEALEKKFGLIRHRLFDNAGNPWEGLNTPLQVDIAQVSQVWSKIAAVRSDGSLPACPVEISEQDAQKRAALGDLLRDVDSELEQINGFLGVGSDGWTSNELFEQSKERARLIKAEGLAAVDDDPWLRRMTEQHWPFDDYNEDE
ncbi:phosphotransferase enzyme family protein [Nannizzia gypsea CBS 118893]|uniref:Phosphotransferase enzyme family protein n=1 Tax=Arthroderma gypseum (strain ATCC MYA-4604 / CBS 118893) TaxID=535722 RepID=E4V1U8_ARTGP|nr:phosphotransferase enzyme family protein [Nannizzia gypsea CBS 118893]EFR04013.1 phosphotransferase enzyme family protein [Nannizzia gypsea CBS 118893]